MQIRTRKRRARTTGRKAKSPMFLRSNFFMKRPGVTHVARPANLTRTVNGLQASPVYAGLCGERAPRRAILEDGTFRALRSARAAECSAMPDHRIAELCPVARREDFGDSKLDLRWIVGVRQPKPLR